MIKIINVKPVINENDEGYSSDYDEGYESN